MIDTYMYAFVEHNAKLNYYIWVIVVPHDKYKKKEKFFRDDEDPLLITVEAVLEKWKRYFDCLRNCDESEKVLIFNLEIENNIECLKPTLEKTKNTNKEVKAVVLNLFKAAGFMGNKIFFNSPFP